MIPKLEPIGEIYRGFLTNMTDVVAGVSEEKFFASEIGSRAITSTTPVRSKCNKCNGSGQLLETAYGLFGNSIRVASCWCCGRLGYHYGQSCPIPAN